MAKFDGWCLAIFGALTLGFGFSDPANIAIGLGLGIMAFIELRGAQQLRQLKPRVLRTLGFNQLALATAIILYALWQLYSSLHGAGLAAAAGGDPQVAQALQQFDPLFRDISAIFYAALIAFALLFQGGLALYYFSRQKVVNEYVQTTPQWIQAVERV